MLIIFDWDGTIIDSAAKIVRSMQQAAQKLGFPECESDKIRHIIGLSLENAIKQLYPEIDLSANQQMQKAYSEAFKANDAIPCNLFPNVEQTLKTLESQGHLTAVATGKSRAGLNRVLANLDWQERFHATRCADETASKPSPLMLNELLVELNTKASDAIMVGDTSYDLEMANNASVDCVAVSYGAHSSASLLPFNPIAVIDHFEQLLDVVANKTNG